MNKIVKYALVGLGGYLIGHYEMKYKMARALFDLYRKVDELPTEENEAQ